MSGRSHSTPFLPSQMGLGLLIFLLFHFALQGQTVESEPTDTFRLNRPGMRSARIPFSFVNNILIIHLTINQHGVLNFILDSGVRSTLFLDRSLSQEFLQPTQYKQRISGLGEGEPLIAHYSPGNTIQIGPIQGINQGIFVLSEDLFEYSKRLGMPIHGLIGYDLLRHFITEIDYSRHYLRFHNPARYRAKKRRNSTRLPLQINGSKPYVNCLIEQANGSLLPVKLLIDTGGSFALWLSPLSNPALKIPKNSRPGFLGQGLNGPIHGQLGRINRIELKPFSLMHPTVSFPDSASVSSVVIKDGRNGSIGGEILRRFKVILNYPNQEILLQPNGFFPKPFYFNLSGIELFTPFPGHNVFVVAEVRTGSPADKAGIRPGDQILWVNGLPSIDYDLNALLNLLQSKAGRTIKMKLKRGNDRFKSHFQLETLL